MKLSDYTIPQQTAITTSGSNIIVSAGAGSGKTQVLTQRVLYFVKNKGYKLKDFLILTFTNLAAHEMKERIRKVLLEEGLDEANNVDIADITTFDSYALSLVKKHHFQLGIGPNLGIVDSAVISVRKRTLITEIFESYYEKRDPIFVQMIKEFCFKDDNEIEELVLEFYDKSMKKIDHQTYWDNFKDEYYGLENIKSIQSVILNLIKKDIESLKQYIAKLPTTQLTKNDDRIYQDVVNDLLGPLFNANTYEKYLQALKIKYVFPTIPKGSSEIEKNANDELKKALNKAINKYKSLPVNDEEFFNYFSRNIPYLQKIIEIVKILDSKVLEYKKNNEVYEFNDIAKMSLNLIKNNETIRDEIKNNLKMIMIDEYQDTSVIQEEFISYIASSNVYMVGDVKQSIYRFRDARSDIFTAKYNKYKNLDGGIAIDLNTNFRSRYEVLDDINYIFKQIMTDETGGANYRKDHVIEYGNMNYLKAGDNKENNNLEFLVYPKQTGDEKAKMEAKLIAIDIIEKVNRGYLVFDMVNKQPILRKCRFSDFCILMDRGTSFDTYLKVFNDYQIPIYAEQDENIKDNQITMIMTNILKLMKAVMNYDFTSDEYKKAFVGVARSFIFNYSDQMLYDIAKNNLYGNNDVIDLIKQIIFQNSYLSIADLFELIIFELNIYQKLIKIGNVNKNELYIDTFVNLFKTMSKLDYSLDDFILYMSHINKYDMKITLTSQSKDIDSVRIMNIHKSKGLEFNIVYFSGQYSPFNQMELDKDFSLSDKFGLILPPQNPNDINILKLLNKLSEQKEDLSEKIRLFYVALTRAREKMIFLYPLDEEEYETYQNASIVNDNGVLDMIEEKFNSFKNDDITLADFVSYISSYNYELTKGFSILSLEKQKEFNSCDIDKIIVDRGENFTDLDEVISFKGFLDKVYYYKKFNKYEIDVTSDVFLLNAMDKEIEYKNLNVKEINITSNEINVHRASKQISLDANKANLDFGNKIHFFMEIIDFKNPDLEIIKEKLYKEIIERFLSSKLMENVSLGNVYKEYEFFDIEENIKGIIDLMIVYENHIDIIDYKTKNIDDEGYNKQLTVYKNYIKKVFNKDINCYLYSLLTGDIKEIR